MAFCGELLNFEFVQGRLVFLLLLFRERREVAIRMILKLIEETHILFPG